MFAVAVAGLRLRERRTLARRHSRIARAADHPPRVLVADGVIRETRFPQPDSLT
jgi:hypothetical protein